MKDDKPLRIVIRNLHPTTPIELIKSELEVRLFEVRQVSIVLHKINKNPQPLFFVDLEPTIQTNDIFKLTSFLHLPKGQRLYTTKSKKKKKYRPIDINQ